VSSSELGAFVKCEVADEALLAALDHQSPEPVVVRLLPDLNSILLAWKNVTHESRVVDLEKVGVVLEELLHDASSHDSIASQPYITVFFYRG